MKQYKIILFKAPTCGPCKMFQPQLEKAVKMFNDESASSNVELILADVSTTDGRDLAIKFNINSTGQALLLDNDITLFTWDRPHSFADVLKDLKQYCI